MVAELSAALAASQKSTTAVASILKPMDEIAFQTNILGATSQQSAQGLTQIREAL